MSITLSHTPNPTGESTRQMVMDVLRNPPLARRSSQARMYLRQLRQGGLAAPNVAVKGWASSLLTSAPSTPTSAGQDLVQLTTLAALSRPHTSSWAPCLATGLVSVALLTLLF